MRAESLWGHAEGSSGRKVKVEDIGENVMSSSKENHRILESYDREDRKLISISCK